MLPEASLAVPASGDYGSGEVAIGIDGKSGIRTTALRGALPLRCATLAGALVVVGVDGARER